MTYYVTKNMIIGLFACASQRFNTQCVSVQSMMHESSALVARLADYSGLDLACWKLLVSTLSTPHTTDLSLWKAPPRSTKTWNRVPARLQRQ